MSIQSSLVARATPRKKVKGEWFAKRPGNAAAVLKLQLNHPWKIKACFLDRNEEEIVVDCRHRVTSPVSR